MKIISMLAFVFLTTNMSFTQNISPKEIEQPVKQSNLYEAYFTQIRLSNNLVFQQELNSRDGGNYVIFEFPLLLKYNITKKLSLLVGPKIDLLIDGLNNSRSASVNTTFGIQYDVSKNILLEAKFNYKVMNDLPVQTDFTSGAKSSYTLGSKIKF